MKTRQLPATMTTASFRAKQRDAGGRLGGIGMPCERERKHEAAKRELEEQQKRERALAAVAAAAQRVRLHNRRMGAIEANLAKNRRMPLAKGITRNAGLGGGPKVTAGIRTVGIYTGRLVQKAAPANQVQKREPDEYDIKADRLRQQLEELAGLSEPEFEVKFRQWLDQEGIAREMHSHLRVELIHCFNNTALGQLLSKAAGVQMAHSHSLLLSPLAVTLHTLVAEFLHSQNCHFSLSVFCSETPHRNRLPDFRRRPEFRFREEELQQVLTAVLGGEETPPDAELTQIAWAHYEEDLAGQTQCLLMALMRSLVEIRRPVQQEKEKEKEKEKEEEQQPVPVSMQDSGCQTEPSACLEVRPGVDTSKLYQAEENELILGADGRSVFVGGRVSQSLHTVEQKMNQLMKNLRQVAKTCAPPIEVMPTTRLEDLLRRELRERERLLKTGIGFDPAKTAIKLAKPVERENTVACAGNPNDEVVESEVGPIRLPVLEVALPRLPYLQEEQLASLAVIRQSVEKAHRKSIQPQGRMYVSMERIETLMGDVCLCVQLLGNLLNLCMEQEHAVGMHKGFKAGYREGFGHGHYMGRQEGQKQEQFDQRKRDKERPPPPELRESAVQVEAKPPAVASRGTQTSRRSTHHGNAHTQTSRRHLRDASNQANLPPESSHKSYEQWINEMLHTSNGQLFLERVELSLVKALELQKARLDELFQVKLRHQAEMLRLSRRQNSWRTLCKRVEEDSQSSTEARELVQKIFRLLEHYETHHQQLTEKIQETELAAEQAARFLPLWTDGDGDGDDASRNWNSAASTTTTSPTNGEPDSAPPPKKVGFQFLALGPPGGIPVAGAVVSVSRRLSVHFAADPVQPPAPIIKSKAPVPPVNIPAGSGSDLPKPSDTKTSSSRKNSAENIPKDPADPRGGASAPPPVPAPRDRPTPVVPAVPSTASISPPTKPSTGLPAEPPAPSAPPKPSMHSVATNTMAPVPLKLAPLKPSSRKSPKGPSFEEALQSAKKRMLQLEQESDLLEHSFLTYLDKAKAKTSGHKSKEEPPKTRRIRSSCLREREQMSRTLDGFRDWHRRVRKEDVASLAQLEELQQQRVIPGAMLDSKVSSPLWLSELEEGHEQDSYPFTNAISEARNKLLGRIMPEAGDWLAGLPSKLPDAPSPVKPPELTADLTGSSSNGEITLLLQRAKEALGLQTPHPLLDSSSSSSSSGSSNLGLPSLGAGKSPNTKLQQSMAKMQLLFGGVDPIKPAANSIPTRRADRPVSAPIAGSGTGLVESLVLPQRPHTAPTLHTISEQVEPPILQLDVSTSSSSQSSLPGRTAGEAFEDLVASAVVGGQRLNAESSQEVSYSQAFWKRMNL
ncbi:uncharacterized protein LOC119556602 [Drosophila subpulchrella]|uniref:uncharacterized protein LOC119556602 n=1 Tax=Drosophila subpulchrella TaxID=1486046 RepID=UPI0018A1997F|nr:uncharacterized protein LOC119556602 [Drosophila subpulchrella]